MVRISTQSWLSAPLEARARWRTELIARLPSTFRPRPLASTVSRSSYGFPEFAHAPTGIEWVCIPESSFDMGLSRDEEVAARRIEDPPSMNLHEMRPVHHVHVDSFMITKSPVSLSVARDAIVLRDLQRPEFPGPPHVTPAYLQRDEAETLRQRLGFELPTEVQWELACRASTRTLFFWGNELPAEKAAIAPFAGSDLSIARPNPFGLIGLFIGEWCRDLYRANYDCEPTDGDCYAVRGGASLFWPWQGSEWVF